MFVNVFEFVDKFELDVCKVFLVFIVDLKFEV